MLCFPKSRRGRINYGLVPYENSIGGVISDTLDAFLESDVHIYAEALIGVEQILMANCAPKKFGGYIPSLKSSISVDDGSQRDCPKSS